MNHTTIQLGVDVPKFREAQSKVVLRPYDHFLEADRWPLAAQAQVDATIDVGWVWKSFDPVALQPPIAWDEVCSHRSHAFALHAWHFLGPVLDTYDRTREFRYLDFAIRLALDWISQYPSTETSSAFAWYDVAIGARAARLAYIIDAAARVSAVPDQPLEQLLSAARMHAQILADDKRFNPHSNHGFYFAAGQLAQARRLALIPGMNDAAHQARERVMSITRTQFSGEGGHREHSPHYHFLVLWTFSRLLASGLLSGAEFDRLSNEIQEALVWFVLPSGHLVNFGDSDSIPMTQNERFHMLNEAFRFVITSGREGKPPREPMRAFPETGYAVMRNGWPTEGERFADWSYLAQTCGYHSDVHKHFDELSFIWYDRGRELLIDGGKYGYVYDDPNRRYVESMNAHNTVTVDGRSWAPRGSRKPYGSALGRWGEAAGVYYTESEVCHWKAVDHVRVLLFRPGEWLIVFDWLSDADGTPHDYVQRFLFAPELEARANDSGVSLTLPEEAGIETEAASAQLHMVSLLAAEQIAPVKGQREPEMLGWVSRKAGTMTPCWSGGYQVTSQSQHAFATLFAFGADQPRPSEVVSAVEDSGRELLLGWRQHDRDHTVTLRRPDEGAIDLDYRVDARGGDAGFDRRAEGDAVATIRYDLELFEQLNDEYREHPIVDVAKTLERRRLLSPQLVSSSEAEQKTITREERAQFAATAQLKPILKDIDMTGKVVLELGCGHGWLTAILPDDAGAAKAIGVDVDWYSSWPEHTDPRVELFQADLSREQVVPAGLVDTIISNVTFEHVTRPLQMLAALYDLLKPGGEAWLRMNLYTSRFASHKYSEIYFPWPQLLFDDDVCDQFYRKHHDKAGQSFAWVNHMTIAHYLRAVRTVGFEIEQVSRSFAPIDLPFYLRFADKLSRYAALDLETDFLTLVLRKGGGEGEDERRDDAAKGLDFDYVSREQELDRRVAELIGSDEGEPVAQAAGEGDVPDGAPAAEAAPESEPAPSATNAASPIDAAASAPANINTPDYWDRIYRGEWESGSVFSATYARDYGPVHEAIIALIPDGARVLDVACGAGVLCRKVKKRLPGTEVMGVDFSPYTIERNRRVDHELGNDYRCLDVETELPSLATTFDVIVMAEIIEHLDHPERAIADAATLLNPTGHLIITCPHDSAIPSTVHVREWGHDELFHLLTAYGDTVCFTQFTPPHDKWMMAHVVTPS